MIDLLSTTFCVSVSVPTTFFVTFKGIPVDTSSRPKNMKPFKIWFSQNNK